MPIVLTPERWRRQPTVAVELDRTHPLAKGIVFAVIGNGPTATDLVGGGQARRIGDGQIKAFATGVGFHAPTVTGAGWYVPYKPEIFRTISSEYSLACEFAAESLGVASSVVSVPLTNNTFAQPQISIRLRRILSEPRIMLEHGISATANRNVAFRDAIFPDTNQTYVVTRKGVTATLQRNGLAIAPSGPLGLEGDTVHFNTATSVCFMQRSETVPGDSAAGGMLWCYFWNRALDPAEQREINQNPYQILKPMPARRHMLGPKTAVPSREGLIDLTLPRPVISAFSSQGTRDFSAEFSTEFGRAAVPVSATVSLTLPLPGISGGIHLDAPPRSAIVAGTLKLPEISVLARRDAPPLQVTVAATLRLPGITAAAARAQPGFEAGGDTVMPAFRHEATGDRTIPDLEAVVEGGLGRPDISVLARADAPMVAVAALALRPPSIAALGKRSDPLNIPGLPHIRAPAWRTVDFGNATTTVNWASPLGPGEVKAYTVNCATELTAVNSTIGGITLTLSALAVLAGLRVYARTNDGTNITLWLYIEAAERDKSNWTQPGEKHTMDLAITATRGQVFERTIGLTIRQIGFNA